MSSGSSRADRAVEPTRSQIITVRWRRSASSRNSGSLAVAEATHRDRALNFAAMPQQNAEVLEILLCKIADDREVNGVVGEALGVFGQAELFEPVRDLLHRNLSPRIYRGLTALLD